MEGMTAAARNGRRRFTSSSRQQIQTTSLVTGLKLLDETVKAR
jgi:hypothetical protein